jgi:hypothetical protein
MELWNESMKMSNEERERRIREHKKNIVPSNSFYVKGKNPPYTNYLGSPENRRAAGIFIRKD